MSSATSHADRTAQTKNLTHQGPLAQPNTFKNLHVAILLRVVSFSTHFLDGSLAASKVRRLERRAGFESCVQQENALIPNPARGNFATSGFFHHPISLCITCGILTQEIAADCWLGKLCCSKNAVIPNPTRGNFGTSGVFGHIPSRPSRQNENT